MSVPSRFVCNACRSVARRTAVSLSSCNGTAARPVWTARPSRSAFSTSTAPRKDKQDPTNTDPEFAFLDAKEIELDVKDSTAATEDAIEPAHASEAVEHALEPDTTPAAMTGSLGDAKPTPSPAPPSIPWYLKKQQSAPRAPIQAAIIPPLPTNPPPILAELLDHLATTAGLDDLTLLDLRALDPPPALGPKLIMILATARSERHLHVSADRFARWLRRSHGLKANAAGLLGRNELKIKLRRKAKRMRLLANVGGGGADTSATGANIDDGIRTGWICCTLSKVPAHPEDTHMPGDDVKEFIGFRDVKPGVNLVVQMFTEEKRADTDLETLWGGVVRTRKREERSADDMLKEAERDLQEMEEEENEEREKEKEKEKEREVKGTVKPVLQFRTPRPSVGDKFPDVDDVKTAKQMRGQMRRLHTVGLGHSNR